jgi:ribonuclease E
MIEPEEKDRWSALAEELGLPPTPTQTPPPISAPSKAQEPAIVEPVEAFESPDPSPPSFRLEEGGEGEPPARGRRRRSAPAVESLHPSAEENADATGEPAPPEGLAEPAEPPADEERPRRRRRVRGSKKPLKSGATEATAAAAETEEAGEEQRPRRRRRRRGKKADKESEAPTAEMEEEKVEETSAEEPDLDEEDEETEDFSTWNVPSWAEIIAGLYRPEH